MELKGQERMTMRSQNLKRLRDLGFPDDFFTEGFWERELEARKTELRLLALMEAKFLAGDYQGMAIPFEEVLARWRAAIAHPLHFASVGWRPNWIDALNDTKAEWAARRTGRRKESWRKSAMKQNEKEREARQK